MSEPSERSSRSQPADKEGKEEMMGALTCDNSAIYPVTTYLEPRTTNLYLVVKDKTKNPVSDAFVTWTTSMGKIGDGASTRTDSTGTAWALFSSFDIGDCVVTAKVTKPGCKTLDVSTQVNVVQSLGTVEVFNKPEIGEILINGNHAGVGHAKSLFSKPTICHVIWGEVEGYVAPQPAKIYVNPKFSTAPLVVEGVYRPANEKPQEIKLTVFAVITLDEQSGIPNPLPKARVVLSDGREAHTDLSGKVEFAIKPESGPIRIEVFHPQVFGLSEFRDVKIADRDLTLNVDFGPWFGGEESVDFTAYGADLVAEAAEDEDEED